MLDVVGDELDFIDPALAYSGSSWAILTMTNDGLVGFRKVGGGQGVQLVADLAESIPTPTNGNRTYTFQVRPGIRYSSGTLVQPADFRRALERVFELGSGGAYLYTALAGADRCQKGKPCDLSRGIVTDRVARTVTFTLASPDGDFLSKLALPFAFAVPESTPSRAVGARPVPATGPYRIAAYRKTTKAIRLERNPRFREWSSDAQPQGFPDSISYTWRTAFDDPSARVRAVERGRGDIAPGNVGPQLPRDELDRLAARYPSRLRTNASFTTLHFFLNTRIAPFDDVRVRRAISNAFDPEEYAAIEGRASAPTCRILPPNVPGFQPTCPYAGGGVTGLDRGRQLIRAAGAQGERVLVWVPFLLTEQGKYMASLLNSLGLRAGVRVMPDIGAYFGKVADPRTRAQMGFGAWVAEIPSAASVIPPLLSCAATAPGVSSNLSRFCDPSIDAQMARARTLQAQDPPAAALEWQQIESELLAQAPVVPTVNRRFVDFLSERVGNYQYNPQWGVLLSQLWVK